MSIKAIAVCRFPTSDGYRVQIGNGMFGGLVLPTKYSERKEAEEVALEITRLFEQEEDSYIYRAKREAKEEILSTIKRWVKLAALYLSLVMLGALAMYMKGV